MNPAISSAIIMFIVVTLILVQEKRKNVLIARTILRKKNKKETLVMKETAKRFIDKRCLIYTVSGGQYIGNIVEVTDGAIIVNDGKETEAFNLDFVMRIREYPKNKKVKDKSIVV